MNTTSAGGSASERSNVSTGWDPYEVWCTRVRGGVRARERRARPLEVDLHFGTGGAKRRSRAVLVWVTLVLATFLGLSRAVMGLFEIDVIADVFGVMTPAARAVYVLLGCAALYCAIALVALSRW